MMLTVKPIALDPRWCANSAALQDIATSLIAELSAHEKQKGKRVRQRKAKDALRFGRAVEAILCNFVAISMIDPERWLMVRLGSYAASTSPIYGKHFNQVVDLMAELGLITKRVGFRVDQQLRAASRIRPTELLVARLAGVDDWSALRLAEEDNTSTALNPEQGITPPSMTPELEAWLESVEVEMAQINECLRKAEIEGDPLGVTHLAQIPKSIADVLMTPSHRTVRRIFNGSYDLGGRIFGGWWETLERSKRFKHIKINGEPIANVDYGQLFLRLAYAFSRATPPAGDLYDLTGTDRLRNDWRELREGRKKLVNALIFNSKELKQWPGETFRERASVSACFPDGTTAREAAKAIKERHHAVADEWFEQGRGLELMRRESDMLVAVLLRLMSAGVTALPLHDSVIVAQRDALLAKRAMEDVARMLIGAEIPVKIETGQDCG